MKNQFKLLAFATISVISLFILPSHSFGQANCATGYVPAPLSTSLSVNGDFSSTGGTTNTGGLNWGQNPATVSGTSYPSPCNFTSQARRCFNNAYPGCGYPNEFCLGNGAHTWAGGVVTINTFPGDPANNVPALNTYYYSNGNDLTTPGGAPAEYLLWAQSISGMTVGRTYTFSCYVNNAIDPPLTAPDDPIIRLRVGGNLGLPDGTVVAGPTTLTEAMCAPTQPMGGWVRIAYTFTATSTSQIFKVTDAATGPSGDDFNITGITVVGCIPTVTATANNPCLGATLNLSATTTASGTFTYSWSGPNSYTATGATPTRTNMVAANYGVYTVTITDALGIIGTNTVTVTQPTQPVNSTTTSSICENTTKSLVGTPSGGTWSVVSGGGSISGTTYTPANVTSNTTATVRYTIGACTADASFTVNSLDLASNLTSTADLCESTTRTLTGTPAGGTWSVVTGGGSISGTTYTPADVSANTTVTVRYTIAANGACAASTSDKTFTVNPNPGNASNTTSSADICETTTKALTGTPAGGTWSIVSGSGSISGTTYTPANVTSTTPVTIRYSVAASGACAATTSDVTFNVNADPGVASNTTSSADICETSTKSLVGTPAGGTWSIVSGGGTISGTTYTPANVTSNTAVTVRYTIAANGSCAATSSDVTFTVNSNPGTASNTTSSADICESSTKALTGTPAGGTWSIVSGGGSIAGTTYTPANVASTTPVTIRYTIASNGGCAATTSDVTFNVNADPGAAVNTTTTTAICETSTKALVGSPSGGTWSIVTGGGSISGTTYTPANVTSNTSVTVRYTMPANGSCPATTSDVTFTVNSDPGTASNTTTTADICETSTKALVGTPAGGTWSIVTGTGSISGTTYTPANVTSNTPVTVRYSIAANGACSGSTSDISFNVNSDPGTASNTTTTADICETTTKALVGTPAGGTWSIITGSGSISGTTYTPANVTSNTPVTVRYSIAANGACSGSTSDVSFNVNFDPGTASNTTTSASICETTTKALVGSPSGGTWSIISGGGSITGTTYTPANVTSNTSVTVRYTIAANGACGATTSDVTFTVNSDPGVASNTTTTTDICETSTKALVGTPSGGTWSVLSGGGSISGTTYTPANVTANTSVVVRYTIAANGSCASTTSDAPFTVNSDPGTATNTTTTSDICESSTKALVGSPAGGTWSVVSGGGSISGTTYIPANVTVNTSVTVRYTIAANGSCAATTADATFMVNVDPGAAVNTTSTADICETSSKALVGSPSGGTWSIVSGGGTISGTTYTPANVTVNTPVTVRYTMPANATCASSSSDVTFNVNFNPGTASNTTSSADICESSTKALTGTPAGGTWSIVSGGGSIAGTTYTPANVASTTPVTIRYTIASNGGCAATTSDVTFNVNADPGAASNTTTTTAICETSTKALVGSPSGGTWSIVTGGGSISGTTYTPANVTSNTSVTVRYTMPANATCPASTSDVTFTVNSDPGTASNTTTTADICETSTKALVGTPAGGTWSIVTGTGSISGTTYTPANVTSNTPVTVRYSIAANGACSGSTSDISFNVNFDPGTASNTTTTADICETTTKALVGSPAGGTWSIITGSGSISGTTYTPANITSNTPVTVRYSIAANGACSGSTSDVSFNVNFDPGTASNTTTSASICETTTKALVGSPSGGTWSIISGGGSITGTTYTPANVTSNTSVTVRYTIAANGACGATTSDVTFTVNSDPGLASNTTTTTDICETSTKALVGTPSGGTWSVLSGGGSISGTTYTPANVTANTSVVVRYTIAANGACAATTSDAPFTVNSDPGTAANTTTTSDVCESSTKALVGSPAGGTWSVVSGGGSISGTTYIPANVTVNTSVTVRYTIAANGSCAATTADATFMVNVDPGAAVNTTSTADICETSSKALVGSPSGGTWSIVSGGGTISGTTYTPANVTVNTPVTVRYTMPANATCASSSSDVTFTVNFDPGTASNTTSSADICESSTKALTGTPAGGTWSIVSGGGSISGTTYTPANVASTTPVTIRYTIASNGGCAATTSDVTFNVNADPGAASNTTTTTAICETSTKALVGSPSGGTWSIVTGGGSISGTTYTPANVTSNTTVTVRYTMPANGSCPATTSDVTFTVNSDPGTASNTTTTADICETSTKALVGTPAGGTWSIVTGSGSISGTTYTPANVASNTPVTVRYSIAANGACSGSTSDISFNVNFDPGTASNTTTTADICETTTKALVGTPAGGTWSIITGSGSISGTTYTPANVTSNTPVTVRYSIAANGACSGSTSDVSFNVNFDPGTASNTTTSASICETTTKALVGSPSGGTWSIISGGGSITGTTYTPANVTSNTSVTVRYTIAANSACGATTSDVIFTVNSDPGVASNTTTTTDICETSTKALVGTPAGGTWSIVTGGGSISGTTYTPTNVTANTAVTVRYTIASNGACAATTSDATFTVNADPGTATNTTTTSDICETSTKSLVGTPTGGTWSIVVGGGTIAGTTYTPSNITVNTPVIVRYTVAANGACVATTSDVTFNVNSDFGTAVNSTSTADICETSTKTLSGSPTGGTWSVTGGGTISGTTYTPANVTSNSIITIRYTIPANGACPATFADAPFIVNVDPGTASNTTSAADICENSTKTLIGAPSGGTWSVTSGSGTIIGTTYTPANVTSNTLVTVRYTIPANSACPATTSDVSFTVNSDPGIANNTTSTTDICEGSTKVLSGTPTGGAWSVVSGGGSITGTTYTSPNVTSNTPITIRYTIAANGACIGSTSDVTFTVNSDPGAASNSTSISSICETATKALAGSPAGGTWSVVSGGGSIVGTTYAPANVNSNTAVTVRYTIPANGSCPITVSDATFTVNFQDTAKNTVDTARICETGTKALAGTPSGGTWSVVSGGGSISGSTYTPADVTTNTLVTVRYTIPVNGSCPISTSDAQFTVNSQDTAKNTVDTARICETGTKALVGTPAGGTWSVISGGGSISGSTYTPADITSNTAVTVRYTTPSNGACVTAKTTDATFTVNFQDTAKNTVDTARICETGTKALAGTPSGGTWSVVSGGGSISGTTYTPADVTTNTLVTVRYTIPVNGSCPISTSDAQFTVNSQDTAKNTVDTARICETGTKALVGTPAGGTWSVISGGGSISGSTYTPADITSNTAVTVRYTTPSNGACVTAKTTDATFTVNFQDTAKNTVDTARICETGTKALAGTPSGGTWSVVSGGGSISGTTYTPADVTTNTLVTVRYTIPVNGSCPISTSDAQFTVNSQDTAKNTVDTARICETGTKALVGTPAGGTWSVVSGGGSISGSTYTPADITSNTAVTVRYTTPSNGACVTAKTTDATFTVNFQDTAKNTVDTARICETGTKALAGTPSGGTWSVVSGGGSISGTTYTPADVTTNTLVTVRYTIPVNGSCPISTSDAQFTVNSQDTAKNTVDTARICETGTKALVGTPAGGTWSVISGGGSISGSTYTPADITSNTAVTVRYTTPSNGACVTAKTTDATFTVNFQDTAKNTVDTARICETGTKALAGTPSGGTWSVVSGGGSISGTTYTPADVTTNTLVTVRYTIPVNGSCPISTSDAQFTVNSQDTAKNTVDTARICETGTKALVGTPAGGTWSVISGGGSISGSTYTPADITSNTTVTVRYTIPVNGACVTAKTTDATFMVNYEDTAKNTVDTARICETGTKALTGTPSGGTWSVVSGGGSISGTTYTPADVVANTAVTLRYTIPFNGACTAPKSADVTFIVNYQDTARNTIDTAQICEISTKALSGTPVGGTWTIVFGGGSISGSTYTPADVSSNTPVTVRYSIPSNGACVTAKTSDATFIVNFQDTARNIVDTARICETGTKSLAGTPSGGTWSVVSGGGSITGTTYTPADVTANTIVTLRYTVPANGACVTAKTTDAIFMVNYQDTAKNMVDTAQLCEISTKPLIGTPAGGTWTIVSGGGSITGTTYTPADVTANTLVRVRYEIPINGACTTAKQTEASFMVNYQLTAKNSTDASSICETDTKLLDGTPSGGTWSIVSGGGSISGTTYTPADITSNTTVTVRYTIPVNGACTTDKTSDVVFMVNSQDTAKNTVDVSNICEVGAGVSTKSLVGSPAGGTWSIVSGGGSISGTTYTPADVTTNTLVTVRYTIPSNGACVTAKTTDATFMVNFQDTAKNTVDTTRFCEISSSGVPTRLLVGSPIGGSWTIVSGGGSISGNTYTPADVTSNTTATLRYTIPSNGACVTAKTSDVSFVVLYTPSAPAVASSNSPLCNGYTLSLTAIGEPGATYSWTGPLGFSSTAQNPTISNTSIAMSGIYNVTQSLNGCPSASMKSVTVLISNCTNPDINATYTNVQVSGNVKTNDNIATGTSYGLPIADSANPNTTLPVMGANGVYTFKTDKPGVYEFNVPVCPSGMTVNCPKELLTITVIDPNTDGGPVANTDIATTKMDSSVVLNTLVNDQSGSIYNNLIPSTVSVVEPPRNGTTVVDLTTGDITYIPASGFVGKDTLKYRVCDNNVPVKCSEAYQFITILPIIYNNTTTAADDYNSGPSTHPMKGNVKLNDMDAEGHTQTVSPQTLSVSGKGTIVIQSDGSYVFTPIEGYNGPVEFIYTTCDNGIPSVCEKATIHLVVKDEAVLNPDVNATFVNVPVTGNLKTNDVVINGTTYGTATGLPGNPGSSVPMINPDGSYSFTTDKPGIYQFNVPVCPPTLTSNCPVQLLTITVLDPNVKDNVPVANTDMATTTMDEPVELKTLSNDQSGNKGTVLVPSSVTITESPKNGTATVNPTTGDIIYSPNFNFVGKDTLRYRVCDNSTPTANCAQAYQVVTILPDGFVNTTTATDDYNSGVSTVPLTGNVKTNDIDPEGHVQTVEAQTLTVSGKGELVLKSDGSYVFTPVRGYNGPLEVIYRTCDNGSPVACTKATLHLLIKDETELNPDVNATFVNVPVTGNLKTNDVVPAGTTYGTASGIGSNPDTSLPVINSDGTYSFVTSKPGVYQFNIPVCPPGVSINCPLQILTITVLDPGKNDNVPVANIDIATTKGVTPVTLGTLDNDKAGNQYSVLVPSSVSIVEQPRNGTAVINPLTGGIEYTPKAGFEGKDTLKYQVCDNSIPTAKCAVSYQIITVLPSSSANVTSASDDYNSGTSTETLTGNVKKNDIDPEGNTQLVVAQTTVIPGKGSFEIKEDGSYVFVPSSGYTGPVETVYTICDNGVPVACAKATLHILVKEDTKLNPDVNITHVNESVSGSVKSNDKVSSGSIYGQPVAFSTNPNSNIPIMGSDGSYTFVSDKPGVYQFNVPVCPSGVTTNCPVSLLTITVLDPSLPNNLPVANTDLGRTKQNVSITLNTLSNDKSGNASTKLVPSSVEIVEQPKNGKVTVDPVTGNTTYTPNTGYVGRDTMRYRVCDDAQPTANCQTAYQFIEILPNNAPNITAATDDYSSGLQGLVQTGNVSKNDQDPEGNKLTVTPQTTVISGKGTLVLSSDGSYTFTPVREFTGPVNFVYTSCDNGTPVECANATLYILVEAAKDYIIPNYISPNGDLVNDNWELPAALYSKYPGTKAIIYNRWGNIVWRSLGEYKNDWDGNDLDGNPLPDGVYYYLLDLKSNLVETLTGFVEIMRR